ncbi:DUF2927 domain-containing protein [Methylophilus sp. QUAN]|uniref:DUF2927 domain-containing protein n=1 Tax=Methylophilus sp. QUAN TaxID=2781020 RepID=UPI00188F0FA3|nr:DUF2927 domain-containing protein [Methylophilus sp. QUAN]MBF4991386.1 DUF2927 domain-containing protein [Methylophilus sp. QUAN]
MIRLMLFSCLLATQAVHADEAWQSPDYLQQAFNEVALHSEYVAGEQVVRKWQQPVKVWLVHHADQADTHTKLTHYHLRHLSRITGHPISFAANAAEANMMVVFSQSAQWHQEVAQVSSHKSRQPPADAMCMFGLTLDAQNAIKRAWVVIPVDHANERGLLVSCIVEEITQAMGLPNDSEKVYPSVFNDKTPESLLTGLDALLLKMLYLPAIKPGMRAGQVQPILARQLQQWQSDGTIQSAEKNVRQSELYDMMGF